MRVLPEPGAARVLTLATLVNTIGHGIWLTASALFLTRSVGLTAAQVGLGLTLVALVNLAASTPMGYLADRHGPRGVQLVALLAAATFNAALIAVRSFPAFVVVGAGAALADAAFRGARGAVIAGAVPPQQRVRTRAYLRSTTNVGISIGTVIGGFGLAADTRTAYTLLILLDTVSFLTAAAILTRLAPIPPVPAPAHGPRLVALRDRPFLVFTLLDGLMSMHFGLLNIALPLWIANYTTAPRWMVSVLFLVNTSMVVLLQVRASRGTEQVHRAARASRRAGMAISAACALFAFSGAAPAPVAVGLLIVGALAHVIGELWNSAAGWGISFGLAPPNAHGQYQGTYGMGMQLGNTLAPIVVTTLAIGLGAPGWLVLGAVFLGLGVLVPPVVAWATRNRLADPGPPAGPAVAGPAGPAVAGPAGAAVAGPAGAAPPDLPAAGGAR